MTTKKGTNPVEAKASSSGNKVMMTVFWNNEGILLPDFVEGMEIVTSSCYECFEKIS